MKNKHNKILYYITIFIGDVILIYLTFLTAYQSRFYLSFITDVFPVTKGTPPWYYYNQFLNLTVILWVFVFLYNRIYKQKFLDDLDEFLLIFKTVTISIALTMAITFVYRRYEFSRLVIGFAWVIGTFYIYFWHELVKYTYRNFIQRIIGKYNILIIGKISNIKSIRDVIHRHRHLRPFFVVDHKPLSEIIDMMNKRDIQEIFVTSTFFTEKEMLELVNKCELSEIDLKIIPDILRLRQGEIVIDDSLNLPIFHIKPVSLFGYNYYYKRIFDIIISIFVLSVLFIPLLMIALLILLDSKGPVLYYHQRKGLQGKDFKFYKFRTMVINADALLSKIRHLSERDGPVFKMKNDPRVTRVGKFLRKFSIDEILQLLNVLRGDMSIVGPRPQVLWEAEAYDDTAKRRLRVLPGITGLWQVSGRASLSYEEMIELDIYYIENWSPGLDIKIIFSTIPAVFTKKGAY